MTDEILSVAKALAVDLARSNLTQAQLGIQLDITQQAVDRWCSRNRVPRRHFRKISQILGENSELLRVARLIQSSMPPEEEVPEPIQKTKILHGVIRRIAQFSGAQVSGPDSAALNRFIGAMYISPYGIPDPELLSKELTIGTRGSDTLICVLVKDTISNAVQFNMLAVGDEVKLEYYSVAEGMCLANTFKQILLNN